MGRLFTALPALLALAVYVGRLDGPFVFDDLQAIVGNDTVHTLSLAALAPPRDSPVAGRPLLNLSFALSWALAGGKPAAFHLHNLLLHCVVVVLGGWVVRSALRSPRLPARVREAATPLSVVAASLWAVHPLASELVLYATQRSELLLALLFLSAFAAFQRSVAAPRPWRVVAFALAALGALAKAVIVVLPPLALLYDRAFIADDWASVWRERRVTHGLLHLSWLPVLVVQLQRPRAASVELFSGDYLLAQTAVVTHYLQTFLWPDTLVFDYGVLVPDHPLHGPLDLIVAGGLVVGAGLLWRLRPAAGFALVWLVLLLAPTSSFAAIHLEIGAERRMYLPMLAMSALLVAGGWLALRAVPKAGPLGASVLLAIVLCLGVRTMARTRDYASEERIWRSGVAAWPTNPRAHHNLGETLRRQGRRDEAIACFRAAVEADPRYVDSHVNLTGLLLERGELAPALRHLETAAELRPADPIVQHNLKLLRARGE